MSNFISKKALKFLIPIIVVALGIFIFKNGYLFGKFLHQWFK